MFMVKNNPTLQYPVWGSSYDISFAITRCVHRILAQILPYSPLMHLPYFVLPYRAFPFPSAYLHIGRVLLLNSQRFDSALWIVELVELNHINGLVVRCFAY